MENITTEQKLELVKQIRSKYNENKSDMSQRERVLYGRTSYSGKDDSISTSMVDRSWYYDEPTDEDSMESFRFGRVRFLIAIILITGVITLDLSGKSLMGVSMDKVFTAIAQDYEEEIAAWVSNVTAEMPDTNASSQKVSDTNVTDKNANANPMETNETKKE